MKPITYFLLLLFLVNCKKEAAVPVTPPASATPVAEFSFTGGNCAAPCEVTFANTSKNATSYTWDFGDGTTWSFDVSPKYTYKKTGTYTIKLTSVGPGGTSQITKPVTIKDPCLSLTLHSGNKQSWDKAHLGVFTTPIAVSVSAGAGPAKEGTVVTWKTSTETSVGSVGTRGLAYFSRISKASTELPGVVASIEGIPGCSTGPLSVTFTDDINVPTSIQLVSATLDQKVSPCASGGKNGTLITPTITFSTPGNLGPYFIRLVEQFRGGSSLAFKNQNWDSKSAPTFTVSNNTIRVSSCYLYGDDLSGDFQYHIELYEKDAAGNPIGKARISNTSPIIKTTRLPDSGRIGQ